MKSLLVSITLAPLTAAFNPTLGDALGHRSSRLHGIVDDIVVDGRDVLQQPVTVVAPRRDVFVKIGSTLIAGTFGLGVRRASSEEKIYSANARNMARLNEGDSSGGSIYDNNPSSAKARRRRAMVGCKNTNARSLAGQSLGQKNLGEKECNMMVMQGDGTFMLEVLAELECPTCPYGIASR